MNPKHGKYPKLSSMDYIPMTQVEKKWLSRRKSPTQLDTEDERNACIWLVTCIMLVLIAIALYFLVTNNAKAEEPVLQNAEYCQELQEGKYAATIEVYEYCNEI